MTPTLCLDLGSSVHRPSAADRLAAVARPLKPERDPYYVRAESRPPTLRRALPASGWYYRPAGHPVVVFLGRNEYEARDELMDQLRRLEAADA